MKYSADTWESDTDDQQPQLQVMGELITNHLENNREMYLQQLEARLVKSESQCSRLVEELRTSTLCEELSYFQQVATSTSIGEQPQHPVSHSNLHSAHAQQSFMEHCQRALECQLASIHQQTWQLRSSNLTLQVKVQELTEELQLLKNKDIKYSCGPSERKLLSASVGGFHASQAPKVLESEYPGFVASVAGGRSNLQNIYCQRSPVKPESLRYKYITNPCQGLADLL